MDLWGWAQRKNSVAINLWGKKTVSFQMRGGTEAPYFQDLSFPTETQVPGGQGWIPNHQGQHVSGPLWKF